MLKRTIVISAVNLNVGGTLTILRDCLSYLSAWAAAGNYKIVALVYKRDLADYPNIEYIETQWPKKNWLNRLWYEYVSMNRISKDIGPVHLWLSLHDTSPNVVAEKRAVYCHNPFPFYRWKWAECFFAPRIVLFALFSKFIYQKNIQQNDLVIVQQQWLKDAFKRLFAIPENKIMVALPAAAAGKEAGRKHHTPGPGKDYVFIYAASPNSHKNFECLCKATAILKAQGTASFKVYLTISGRENRYAARLYKHWGRTNEYLQFIGFQSREALFALYEQSNCLVFPSRIETWGLPISEFATLNKPMLLADLPYARETAAGSRQVAFFNPDGPIELAGQMKRLIEADQSFLSVVPAQVIEAPIVRSWAGLFDLLLQS